MMHTSAMPAPPPATRFFQNGGALFFVSGSDIWMNLRREKALCQSKRKKPIRQMILSLRDTSTSLLRHQKVHQSLQDTLWSWKRAFRVVERRLEQKKEKPLFCSSRPDRVEAHRETLTSCCQCNASYCGRDREEGVHSSRERAQQKRIQGCIHPHRWREASGWTLLGLVASMTYPQATQQKVNESAIWSFRETEMRVVVQSRFFIGSAGEADEGPERRREDVGESPVPWAAGWQPCHSSEEQETEHALFETQAPCSGPREQHDSGPATSPRQSRLSSLLFFLPSLFLSQP